MMRAGLTTRLSSCLRKNDFITAIGSHFDRTSKNGGLHHTEAPCITTHSRVTCLPQHSAGQERYPHAVTVLHHHAHPMTEAAGEAAGSQRLL